MSGIALTQTNAGTLRGLVTDPTGAVVPQATISTIAADGKALTATTNNHGTYEFKSLSAGNYTVTATAKGFSVFAQSEVAVTAGQLRQFDIALEVAVQQEHVQVEDESATVDVGSDNNASAIVIKDKDLDALSDDPDELQSELQALAGPSAGPNGGQIYIDGFSNGQLPPKSSIREIRVNQNPFSPEYDKLGYGRVEVFTKPGTDTLHGRIFFNDNNSLFNSHNPFLGNATQPGYNTRMVEGTIGGPLNKKASYNFNFERRNIGELAIVNATNFDGNQFSQAVPNPRIRTEINPRLDVQLTPGNTATFRYQYNSNREDNSGVGKTNLVSQATNLRSTGQRLQISDTQVIDTQTVNETRFQYSRDHNSLLSLDASPALVLPQTFTAGGNSNGDQVDHNDRVELQNYTSRIQGKHILKFGGRLRVSHDTNYSTSNFNGTYTFTQSPWEQPGCPADSWADLLANANRCGVAQRSITTGQPLLRETWSDAGLYVSDDWRVMQKLTLSYGLRFETQSDSSHPADFAPRVGMAWGLGRGKSTPKTVLRAGFGYFYDRVSQDTVMTTARNNGITTNQQQFGLAPDGTWSPTGLPVTTQLAPGLRAPYTLQTGISLERQLGKAATGSMTYLNSRGIHVLDVRNINSPINGMYPLGLASRVNQIESEGIFKQNQLIANVNIRLGAKLSLFSYYTLNHANSDSSGISTPPFNEQNLSANYGRAAYDIRHRIFLGGSMGLPYNFRISPFLIASSGSPFNITTNKDINEDNVIGNDRPYFNGISSCNGTLTSQDFIRTPTTPNAVPVPVNCGTGSPQFSLSLRLAKTFGFGKKTETKVAGGHGGPGMGGGGEHGRGPGGPGGFGGGGPINLGGTTNQRYNVTFSVSARNLLNFVSPAAPVGNIDNLNNFGKPIALAGGPGGGPFGSSTSNRRVDLQVMFSF